MLEGLAKARHPAAKAATQAPAKQGWPRSAAAMQTSQYACAPMRKRVPLCTEVHLLWQHYEAALPRSSALQKGHAHCPCNPFLPTSDTARQRVREVLRDTSASNLLRVSHRAAAMARKSPLDLRTDRINSNRSRLTRRRHKPHASSFAPKRRAHDRILHRHINWENRNAEGRMSSGPILHALLNLMAKPLWLHAARLGSANRQTLEELIPKFLQIFLHAEPPALLFYRGKR